MVAFLASYFPGQWKVRFLHHARAKSPMELAPTHSWSFKPCKKRRKSNCTHPTLVRRATALTQHVRGPKFWTDHPKPQGCYLIARLDQLTNGPQGGVRRQHPPTPGGKNRKEEERRWVSGPIAPAHHSPGTVRSPRLPRPRHCKKPRSSINNYSPPINQQR